MIARSDEPQRLPVNLDDVMILSGDGDRQSSCVEDCKLTDILRKPPLLPHAYTINATLSAPRAAKDEL